MTNNSKPVQCILYLSNTGYPLWEEQLEQTMVARLDSVLQVVNCTEEEFTTLTKFFKQKNQKNGWSIL